MSSLPLPVARPFEDDDSEDDPDFVPPAGESGSSSESDSESRETKRLKKSCPEETEDDRAKKEKARTKLWAEFQASVSTPPPPRPPSEAKRMIKVVKQYRFGGEALTKVEEVPADSNDAKKWPRWDPQTQTTLPITSTDPGASPSPAASSSSTPQPEGSAVPKRPGPRKSRKSLDAMFATAKAKKLTTLDKSAMDWKEHVDSSQDLKDDLEANRRGGGYLEKVEFLQRVEERTEAARAGGSKRRRM